MGRWRGENPSPGEQYATRRGLRTGQSQGPGKGPHRVSRGLEASTPCWLGHGGAERKRGSLWFSEMGRDATEGRKRRPGPARAARSRLLAAAITLRFVTEKVFLPPPLYIGCAHWILEIREKYHTITPILPTCTEKPPGTYTASADPKTETNTENTYPAGKQSKVPETARACAKSERGTTRYSPYQAAPWDSHSVRETNGRKNYLLAYKVGTASCVLGSMCPTTSRSLMRACRGDSVVCAQHK